MANMREAARSYEANMNMFEAGRRMRSQLLDLLK
jgi:flagellar basal-body rod protein FlgC